MWFWGLLIYKLVVILSVLFVFLLLMINILIWLSDCFWIEWIYWISELFRLYVVIINVMLEILDICNVEILLI